MAKDKNEEPKIELKKPNAAGEDQTAKIPKPLKPAATDDQKVVLNSGTDSAIRPSDATRMAPAVVPPAQKEETVTMGKDEVKDVPNVAKPPAPGADDSTQKTVKPPAPVSSKDIKAKTIKLKPLKPTTEDEDNQEETLSMERDALLDKDMPSSLGAPPPAAAPAAAPAAEAPAPSTDDEATIKIQKPTTTKPSHPVPNIPGAKETIKLRPSNTTPPPPAAPGAADDSDSQETVSMSKKTIRLVPKKAGTETDDSTQKTAKPSAPTVKLTDSKGPAAAAPGAPAAPAAPTAQAPAAAAAPAAPPASAAPSAPTVKLPEPAAAPPAATGGGGSKRTLKLKSSAKTVATPPPGATEPGQDAPPAGGAPPADAKAKAKKPKKKKDPEKGAEAGIIMTIAAFFTLLLVAYYAWMAVGQWAEGQMDMTKSANVPGLSGSVKPPR